MNNICLTLPLPVGMPWYEEFVKTLKHYATFCDMYISLAGIIEDIISPTNDLSENFSYLCDQLYAGFLDNVGNGAYTKQQSDDLFDRFSESLDNCFWEFKNYYLNYLMAIDVSDDNETGILSVSVKDLFDTTVIIEIDGAKYAPLPVLRYPGTYQSMPNYGSTPQPL